MKHLGSSITLDHGSGGRASRDLVEHLIVPKLHNETLARLNDCAELRVSSDRLAFTTDSYVVSPLFYAGGGIGSLAVNGTINDLAMGGAMPIALSLSLIIEEGFAIDELALVLDDIARAANFAEVPITTGDTKVVPRGAADKLFVNTSGVGVVRGGTQVGASMGKPGDRILVSGPIGSHGAAVFLERSQLGFQSPCESDSQPLHRLVSKMLDACPEIHCLRDATRGGLAATLNELAGQSKVQVVIDEARIALGSGVGEACGLLGFDPLHLANEGVLVAWVPEPHASRVLEAMRLTREGAYAHEIGWVEEGAPRVIATTLVGGKRRIGLPLGIPLPRIC